jgi:hypothetical protein
LLGKITSRFGFNWSNGWQININFIRQLFSLLENVNE